MHGLGSLSMKDGSEWEYALWARIGGPGVSVSGGMLMPVTPPPGETQMPVRLDEDLQILCRAMDYFGEGGVVARLAAGEKEKTPARRVELGGESVLLVELSSVGIMGAETRHPDEWQVYVDPKTMLVRQMKLFMVEAGKPVLRALCKYRYDEPLPPGFDERLDQTGAAED
jgi:hypothetical protein